MDCNKEYFTLKDLLFHNENNSETLVKGIMKGFPSRFYESETISTLLKNCSQSSHHLNSDIIRILSKKIGLHFGGEEGYAGAEDPNSPVCYAGSSEVSDDFKIEQPPQSFSELDVLDYACGFLGSNLSADEQATAGDQMQIPYPSCQVDFWKCVAEGRTMREKYFSDSGKK